MVELPPVWRKVSLLLLTGLLGIDQGLVRVLRALEFCYGPPLGLVWVASAVSWRAFLIAASVAE